MNRTKFINSLLSKKDTKNYLVIGVRNGENFFAIRSKDKVGIDPNYFFKKISFKVTSKTL